MKRNKQKSILITGFSGYVGSNLLEKINGYNILGIDKKNCSDNNFFVDLALPDTNQQLIRLFSKIKIDYVIHLAAAKQDYGLSKKKYFNDNVEATNNLLKFLKTKKIKYFLHISSVATFEGKNISSNKVNLNPDESYQLTKALQEKAVIHFCKNEKINYCILYPSAIFSNKYRFDTNIGKLQFLTRYFPFSPKIKIKKSLTYLDNLTNFIIHCINNLVTGKYLTIERPVLNVNEIIKLLVYPKKIFIINIPFIKYILKIAVYPFSILKYFGIDYGLTLNRIDKLFKDTSFDDYEFRDFDTETYCKDSLISILKKISN